MTAITLTPSQMADMDEVAAYGCKLTEQELDSFITDKRTRVFEVKVVTRDGRSFEVPHIGFRSGDVAEWALDKFGLDSYVSVRPA